MPSSYAEPSPSFPIYIPGRILICSFQSNDLILSSVYVDVCAMNFEYPNI